MQKQLPTVRFGTVTIVWEYDSDLEISTAFEVLDRKNNVIFTHDDISMVNKFLDKIK